MPARSTASASTKSPAAETGPAPVVALVGNDSFLQVQALTRIVEAMGEQTQRSDVDGPRADAADVFDELRSFAMFGGRRLVVVRDADDFISAHRATLESYLEGLSGDGGGNVLVLRCASLPKNTRVYKLIDKAGEVIPCEPPNQRDLPRWIADHARRAHGLRLPLAAAGMLADLIGNDLGSLDNELAKLALQSPDGTVDPESIAGSVAFRREQQMWIMTDALTAGRPEEALRIWRQLLATDSSAEFRAVTWLAIWLEKASGALRLAGEGRRPIDIAKELRIWPAQNVDPLLRTARALGPAGLRQATDRLAELDFRTKTGLGEAIRAVEEFIARAGR